MEARNALTTRLRTCLLAALVAGVPFLVDHPVRTAAQEVAESERAASARADRESVGREPCSAKIVGGCQSVAGSWPSMAIMHPANDINWVSCGGTVIDPYWVVTAAHCVLHYDENATVNAASALPLSNTQPGEIVVREGVLRFDTTDPADAGRIIKVVEIIPHEKYTVFQTPEGERDFRNDIALLRLASPARAPRQALARRASVAWFTEPGRMSTVAGFGKTQQGGEQSSRLLQVDLPIIPEGGCKLAYPLVEYSSRVCAGIEQGGRDSCSGDSGGPLYVRDQLKQPVQVGLVSFGRGCANPNTPGVYSSVGAHEDWIRQRVPNAVFIDAAGNQAGGGVNPIPGLDEFIGDDAPDHPSQFATVTVDIVQGNQIRVGEQIVIRVTSSVDGRLIVLNRDEKGRTTQLFPNNFSNATTGGLARETVRAGETVEIPGPDASFALRATLPVGVNQVVALVTPPNAETSTLTQPGKSLKPIADPAGFIAAITAASKAAEAARDLSILGPAEDPPAAEAPPAAVGPPPTAEAPPATGGTPVAAAPPGTQRGLGKRRYEIVN